MSAKWRAKPSLSGWQRVFFREEVFSPGQPEAAAKAPAEAAFIVRALGLKKGAQVLDLCCGTGRHSLPLARRGLRVTGLDATEAYLKRARAASDGRNPIFLKSDMRRLTFQARFDAAINLWTSFGYFLDPADDLRTLKAVARALKPGGLFLIDLMNWGWLKRNFQPKRWERRGDGSYLLEEARLLEGPDCATVNRWTVLRRGRPAAGASFFVRNYDAARLSRALRRAGLRPVRRWGGLDGAPFRGDSPRLVVLARRPGR